MTTPEIAELIRLLKANGVTRFKSEELEIRLSEETQRVPLATPKPNTRKVQKLVAKEKDIPLQAIPPVDEDIVHHVNEVAGLLKLSDEQLVDRMFPDYTQGASSAN